jgi:RNA polymerase sigma-70 factor (ECF subfamily)
VTEPAVDWRSERPRIVGALARRFGDLALAEDAIQEAFAAAADAWPRDGMPDRPAAWITTTAYRKAIGLLRRQHPVEALDDDRPDLTPVIDAPAVSDDDLFCLLLTCCHPALAPDARIALTLRHVCGLEVDQIAAAFLVSEAAMAKRLVRARSKIRTAGISFDRPDHDALDSRIDEVRAIIYLVFNEGYLGSTAAATAVDVDLCGEAVWLARDLCALRGDDESLGLLALCLIQHARRAARTDDAGALVVFADQDPVRWDAAAIEEARQVLATLSGRDVGRYQLEAAIALLHVTSGGPRWDRIADLYAVLARRFPSPVVTVNQAHAVWRADGAPAGLAVLAPLLESRTIDDYGPLHAVHAALLQAAGRHDEARLAWQRAAEHTAQPETRDALLVRTPPTTRRRDGST